MYFFKIKKTCDLASSERLVFFSTQLRFILWNRISIFHLVESCPFSFMTTHHLYTLSFTVLNFTQS